MMYKLKIIEFFYDTEEDMDMKLDSIMTELRNHGWSVKVKQILETRVKYTEEFGDKNYIKLVLELT